jgi:hypothetical protein
MEIAFVSGSIAKFVISFGFVASGCSQMVFVKTIKGRSIDIPNPVKRYIRFARKKVSCFNSST